MIKKTFAIIYFLPLFFLLIQTKSAWSQISKKICIIVPAYNEEHRIQMMLGAYLPYFQARKKELDITFLVVANNCSDQTVVICKKIQKQHSNLEVLDLKPGGKGFALKQGFLYALQKPYDYIGFVDADLATLPCYYDDLIKAMEGVDGVIASRYMPGACVWPKRPWLRKLGGKFYNWLLNRQLKISFKDTQCGAKIFTYDTIKKVAPEMTEQRWAWDLEFLYLCRLEDKIIKEVPTTWSDQPGSHLIISSSLMKEFLASPKRIKKVHREKALQKKKEKRCLKRAKKNKKLPFINEALL
ncbi:glycosyltransferase [Candidatus Dependentiae bacterium]|nr:glycosyltransferase [Candidatus Dependentiae bacterium]